LTSEEKKAEIFLKTESRKNGLLILRTRTSEAISAFILASPRFSADPFLRYFPTKMVIPGSKMQNFLSGLEVLPSDSEDHKTDSLLKTECLKNHRAILMEKEISSGPTPKVSRNAIAS